MATRVQGAAASGDATAGNPVLVAGSDGTNVRTMRMEDDNSDNVAASATKHHPAVIAKLQVFDGTAWDRLPGDATYGLKVQGTAGMTPVQAALATPPAADVLAGHVAHTSTTGATTIITVAAGETWRGTIGIVCDVANAAANSTAGQALGTITTAGTGVTPSAGTYLTCEARAGANAATGTVGSQGANAVSATDFVIVAPAGNSVTLQGASTIAGSAGRVAFFASGTYI